MLPSITFYQQYLRRLFDWDCSSNFLDSTAFDLLNNQIKRFESPQAQHYCSALDLSVPIADRFERLKPWRKGPFECDGVFLDAEWRCNLKWNRLERLCEKLGLNSLFYNKTVLDVGCGNGYYLFQVLNQQPKVAFGIDPSALYFFQFQLLQHYYSSESVFFLPIGWQDLSVFLTPFDVVMCMGVLYHHSQPLELLYRCKASLKDGGYFVLETLVIESDDDTGLQIYPDRYACMSNVYELPSLKRLKRWILEAGFESVDFGDVVPTTSEEQRVTRWSSNKSLSDFLTESGDRTIEGYPAPRRVIAICN